MTASGRPIVWSGFSIWNAEKHFVGAFENAAECERELRARTAELGVVEGAFSGKVLATSKAHAEEAIRRGRWESHGLRQAGTTIREPVGRTAGGGRS